MLSSQEEQAERRRVFAQDQSVPNKGSTFHQHALADAQTPRGRYDPVTTATVIGSKSDVSGAYPAAAAHQHDPCGPEPSLGYRIHDLNPSDLEQSPPAQGNSAAQESVPSPRDLGDVERGTEPSLSHSRTYRRA
jgi:hypothetical protein